MKYSKNNCLGGYGLGFKFEEWCFENTDLTRDQIDLIDQDTTIGEGTEKLIARSHKIVIQYLEENPTEGIVIVNIPHPPEDLVIIDERGYETIALKSELY